MHRFRVDNNECELVIVYDMIIGHDLMVQMGGFNCQVLQRGGAAVPMKQSSSFIGQTFLGGHKMHDVLMQTAEQYFKSEATEK